jgi:hypothetical protein
MTVLVTEMQGGYECCIANATGSPVCGRGITVTEAVGDWAIQSGTVKVAVDCPCYWDEYKAESVRGFKPIPRRD